MSYLELHDIHKSYYLGKEEFPVLKGISLNFERGEFVSILGESGGGKSTLMNIIGGLDHNYQGDVLINDKSLKNANEKAMDAYRRETIGFIFQSFNLINHLSILDNVKTSLDMTTLSRSQREKRASDLLEKVGLKDHIKKYPNQLSGGQKQRVAIARALASDPDMIIADEPTGALDSKNTQEVLDLLQEIAQDGKLVIVVTHSKDVADFGTRIVHMSDGKIDQDENLKPPYPVNPEQKKNFTSKNLPAMDSYKNAFRHLMFHMKRNFLIILGTAIGIFSVMFFLGLGNGATNYMNHTVESVANPQVLQVIKNSSENEGSNLSADFTNTDIKKLAKVDHVSKYQKSYFVQSFSAKIDNKNLNGQILQTMNDSIKTDEIKPGNAPKSKEIVVAKQLAKSWNKDNWKKIIGKKITISMTTLGNDKKPVVISEDLTVSGIQETGNAITYDTLSDAFNKNNISLKPNFVTLKIDNVKNVKEAKNTITAMRNSDNKKIFLISGVASFLDTITQVTSIVSFVLALIAGISLIVSALMIIVTMYMSVTERTKEIGILRALGERRKDIRRLFTSESLYIGLLSAFFALILSFIAQYLVNQGTKGIINYNGIIAISVGNIIAAFIIAIIISLIAAFLPSRKAAKLDPIESLSSD